jgi:hypothetical protein
MLGYNFLILSLSIDIWNDRLLGSPAVINNPNQARSLNIYSFNAYDTNLLPVDMAPRRKIGRQLFVPKTRVSGRGHKRPQLPSAVNIPAPEHDMREKPAIEPRFAAPHVAAVEVQHRLRLETAEDPWIEPRARSGSAYIQL